MKQIRGQILGEAIVAMGIITIGVLGVTGFLARSISEGRGIADQVTAANLAAEGIEITKNILDGNALRRFAGQTVAWNQGFTQEGFFEIDFRSSALTWVSATENKNVLRPLLKEQIGEALFYSYTGDINTNFKRSIEIRRGINDHHIRVAARVYWIAREGRLNQVIIASDFYNWR